MFKVRSSRLPLISLISLALIWLLSSPKPACLAEDWPQWMGPNRDNVWRESNIIESFPKVGVNVLWRHPVGGGYAGPAVSRGRVYIADFQPEKALTESPQGRLSQGKERILCLDEHTGELLWKHDDPVTYTISYPAGPRCTPNVEEDRVYTLGAQGNLHCLDATTGRPRWSRNLPAEYSTQPAIWGYAGHPLIVGDKLICIAGGPESLVIALDKFTGKEIWRSLSSSGQGYTPPVLINAAGRPQLIIFHPDGVSALNPDNGQHYWTVDYQASNGSVIMSPVKSGNLLYAAGFSNKNLMIRLSDDHPGATLLWQDISDAAVSPVNVQPFTDQDMLYGFHQDGTLFGIDFATGKRVWSSLEPLQSKRALRTGTAFIIKQADRYWLFTEQGDLVIAKMSRQGYQELDRTHVLDATDVAFGRKVVWSAPAFANQKIFLRNGKECICIDAKRASKEVPASNRE